jgi:hypothetical protein
MQNNKPSGKGKPRRKSKGAQLRQGDKDLEVMMLALQNYTYRQIANITGYSLTAVHDSIARSLKKTNSELSLSTEEYRTMRLGSAFESLGELADLRDQIDKMRTTKSGKFEKKLRIIAARGPIEDRIIKLMNLEVPKNSDGGGSNGGALESKYINENADLLDSLSRNGYIITKPTE